MNAFSIKKRKEYYSVYANGKKVNGKNFNVQYLETNSNFVRFGITVSKKIGNAVTRNHSKRRIKALIKKIISTSHLCTKDYIVVAKKGTAYKNFDILYKELENLIQKTKK